MSEKQYWEISLLKLVDAYDDAMRIANGLGKVEDSISEYAILITYVVSNIIAIMYMVLQWYYVALYVEVFPALILTITWLTCNILSRYYYKKASYFLEYIEDVKRKLK